MKKYLALMVCLVLALSMTIIGCTGDTSSKDGSADSSKKLDKITLQSKWLPQAQFMGYYVAQNKGYYEEEGIEIEILPGSSDFTPESQVISGNADIGVSWYSSLLTYQEKGGSDLINVAQIFQKSALGLVTKKDSGIKTGADLKGKTVGSWFGGNEYEIYALLGKNNLQYKDNKDVTLVQQDFTMDAFLKGEIKAASAMTYNEYGLVLESGVKAEDLNFIDMNDAGVAMMQDCLVVSKKWAEENKDLLVRFLKASFKGWKYSCENPDEAGKIVYSIGKSVSEAHQVYMAKEVAKVVAPSGFDLGKIGQLNSSSLQQTITLGKTYGLIKSDIALSSSVDSTYWTEATK